MIKSGYTAVNEAGNYGKSKRVSYSDDKGNIANIITIGKSINIGIGKKGTNGSDKDLVAKTEKEAKRLGVFVNNDHGVVEVQGKVSEIMRSLGMKLDESFDMNESSKIPDKYRESLVAMKEAHSKEYEKLKKNEKRLKEISKIVAEKGFEGAMPYRDEYHRILDEAPKLIRIIEGKANIIAGYGILSLIEEELS